jgi:GAF domain-containing protein
MQRRGESGQPVKGRKLRHKARKAPTAPFPDANLQEQLDRAMRERDEALEQLAATSEVLQVISSSPGKLELVFQAMLENALRICEAKFGTLYLCDGDTLRPVADTRRAPRAYSEARKRKPRLPPVPDGPVGRVLITKQVVHIADISKLQSYLEHHPTVIDAVELGGFRTALGVPMLRDSELIGVINIMRQEVRPFTDRQIELVKNFASQAVIAIENTRLLNELHESLQQQTATADVLKVISRSTFDLQTVLDTLTESAAHLCRAERSAVRLVKENLYHHVASYGFSREFEERMQHEPLKPGRGSIVGRVVVEGKSIHIIDGQADPDSELANRSRLGNVRTVLGVPLLREGTPIGVLLLQRGIVEPFTSKEIELAETFADQAVIAIENTRLFEAEQQRTRELSEALEQQTATSEVLKVISSSPGQLEPVFDAMLANATRICEARFGTLYLRDGNGFRAVVATRDAPPAYVEARKRARRIQPSPDGPVGRAASTKQVAHIADLSKLQSYLEHRSVIADAVELGGFRTALGVPMLKDDELIGVITILRQEVRLFTDKQIELVKNFAAQAVIAIENTRLLNELRESLQQQTATADVLKVISSSPGELTPVFGSMLENAVRICEASFGNLLLYENDVFRDVALHNAPEAWAAKMQRDPVAPRHSARFLYHVADTKQVTQIADITTENPDEPIAKVAGARTLLIVPMLKGSTLVGAIAIYRQEVRPFTDKQTELVQNFAAQAVIAIENTRLLNELRESLQQQTATADVLKVISSSPGDLAPVFKAMLENAVHICEAKFGHMFLSEGETFRVVALESGTLPYPDWLREGSNLELRANPQGPLAQIAATGKIVHIGDLTAEVPYRERNPRMVALVESSGARTFLGVPMFRGETLMGAIGIYRQEVRPFTDKQIALVQNFAAQAVIAIENSRLLNELRQRTSDLSEALEQQTATSEVLRVISSSQGELQPVFDSLLDNATRLCGAKFGSMFLCEGDDFRVVAHHKNTPPAIAELRRRDPIVRAGPSTAVRRSTKTKQAVQIPDIMAESAYSERDPNRIALVELGGYRAVLSVPMLKDNEVIGAINIYRQETGAFEDKQVELVKNFAAQAVIAIENTRLLSELRESLQQQTATADVLKVISSSPGDLGPVFEAMLANAVHICEAKFGVMWRFDGEENYPVAMLNLPASADEFLRRRGRRKPTPGSDLDVLRTSKQSVHTLDMVASSHPTRIAKSAGVRTQLAVPLLLETELVGAITIYRQEVRPFTEKQIDLVKNFAAQAVIAIENTRLLNELRQRTADLSEALEQQTATSEVLKVISSSPGDLQPVFDAILARFATLRLSEGDQLRTVNLYNAPAALVEHWRSTPLVRPHPESALGRAALTKQVVQIEDVTKGPAYRKGDPLVLAGANLGGYRTVLAVPMLKENDLIGIISIYHQEVRPFTDKQIELVQNFAAQAVIAIENTRLLNELRESLQQQTATADVLKVISRSTFDLRTVLQTLIESAARLCDADKGNITREKRGIFYRAAESYGYSPEFLDHIKGMPIEMDRGSATGRSLLEKRVIHIPDAKGDPEYTLVEAQRLGDYRTVLAVPMLREGIPLGVLTLTRSEVRPFTDKQIELVTTFADQAAIAIENVRLFESVEARTRELAKSLEDLRTTQDRLVQTQKLASLGQLTAGIAHEIKNPLNFVNNFSGVSAELIDELQDTLKGPIDDKTRAEIKELTDTLKGNLDKIVQHGKRADAIVKNMLLHSREGSGEHRPVDVNALVEESLSLAYHGARAEKQGFTITLQRSFDPTVGEADIFPQDITRALLNLIINGFYAATKRRAEANAGNYEPTLAAATKNLGDRVEITIRDNGIGVPLDVKEKMFNPFFTTKPAGEGTGLGLSISHDIIVKQHGGSIEVETQPGEFTEIRVILPRVAALLPERS